MYRGASPALPVAARDPSVVRRLPAASRAAPISTMCPCTSADFPVGVDTFSRRTRHSKPRRIVSRLPIGIAMLDTTTGSGTAPTNLIFRRVSVVTLMSGPPSVGNVARGSNRTSPGIGVCVLTKRAPSSVALC